MKFLFYDKKKTISEFAIRENYSKFHVIKKFTEFYVFQGCTVQNFSKIIICSLSVLCFPRLILTRSPKISGQDKSEAREPEGLVKINSGIVTSSLFKRAGNLN